MAIRPLTVVVFVQLVNTLFGSPSAGNEDCKTAHWTRMARGESMHMSAN
jgi:hypothetical protein